MITKPYWPDSGTARVIEKLNRHRMVRRIMRPLRRECSRTSLLYRDNGRAEQEMNILASSKTGLWINETITKKRNELRDCMRSMETATPEPHQGLSSTTTKSTIYWDRKGFWACHTPKRSGGGTTIHQQVLHPQVGKQLHGGNLLHGKSDNFCLTDSRCFR